MRVAIFSNPTGGSVRVTKQLTEKLKDTSIIIDNENPDVILTVGGDGTLLSAVHHYQHQLDHVRFVGIHTGHLGFYTDWRDYEVDQLVESLKKDTGQQVTYPLLDVDITYVDGDVKHFTALNESTVKKAVTTLVCDIYIKGKLFERFRGDGLCISTPTGSTGYNKSIGGAVMDPSLVGIQLGEIASINNRVFRTLGSPIIVGKDQFLDLVLKTDDRLIVSCDQMQAHDLDNPKRVRQLHYQISKSKIAFARYRHTNFWQRVDEAFIGGVK